MTQRSESGMKMWHNICFWYFEWSNRKEGRSKEEKGVMTSEKWIGRSEESMKIV